MALIIFFKFWRACNVVDPQIKNSKHLIFFESQHSENVEERKCNLRTIRFYFK